MLAKTVPTNPASGMKEYVPRRRDKHPFTYLRLESVKKIIIVILVLAGFRPNLAPRPVPTGRAPKMVQNAPKIS